MLVDQTDERCEAYFASEGGRRNRILTTVYPAIARLGLMRPLLRRRAQAMPRALRDEYRAY